MVNINGKLVADDQAKVTVDNRGYTYGDAVFETIKVRSGKVLFWEAHYFRLMASMRILRMQIPMEFTPESLEKEIIHLVGAHGFLSRAVRVKIMVHRKVGGLYTPVDRSVEYNMIVREIPHNDYILSNSETYEVTLFKDHYVASDLLSTIKTNNKIINVLAGVFAEENDFDNCLLLNTEKKVVEALNGNLFLVKGNVIKTPPVSDGCLKGILRGQLMKLIEKNPELILEESSISPFELQKADELFITNVISGIIPVTKFRKKIFSSETATFLMDALNKKIGIEH